MARRGRPRSSRAASATLIFVKMRLYPGDDDDLLAFFASIPCGLRATMVKSALRSGVSSESVAADEDVDGFLDALESLID